MFVEVSEHRTNNVDPDQKPRYVAERVWSGSTLFANVPFMER